MRLFMAESFDRKNGPLSRLKRVMLFLLLVCGALMLAAGVIFVRALPRMERIVASSARTKASAEIDEAVISYMETNSLTYGSLVNMHYDENGAVTSVTADTAGIDAVIARMDDEIGCELEEKLMETSIPLNVLLGIDIFAGAGPWIDVHFFPINIVNVATRHEFISQGINQTLHTIYLDITVDIEVLLPLKNRVEKVDATIPIGQTLIVGSVPQTYVER